MDFQHSLSLIAPEIVLSLSGLALLLAAAWLGDKASRGISIAACVALGAAFFLVAPAVCGGAAGAGPSPISLVVTSGFGSPMTRRESPAGLARATRASSAAMSCRIGARKLSG